MNKGVFIVLDIGTSNIKCACVNSDRVVLVANQREFPMKQNKHRFEVDFEVFLNIAKELIGQCIADNAIQNTTIEALLITSQANTFAPVDATFSPLTKGIVWLDERAEKEAEYLSKKFSKYSETAGFISPLSSLYVSKLLWLKRNTPKVFKNARFFPLINEFLVYKLTNQFYADTTSFGMSGMYDFQKNEINKELLQILNLTNENFPLIENAAKKSALISKEVMQEWKMTKRFPVLLCGNDQSASASGAGLKKVGDLNINFGSAMVLFSITKNLVNDLGVSQIAGKYPIGDKYFLLSYESDFGLKIRSLKEQFFKNGSYDQLFQTYLDYPKTEIISTNLPIDNLIFENVKDGYSYSASIISYYIHQLKKHIETISKQVKINTVFLSGGMTNSAVWIEIIKKELKQTIVIDNQANAGLLGAINIYSLNKK